MFEFLYAVTHYKKGSLRAIPYVRSDSHPQKRWRHKEMKLYISTRRYPLPYGRTYRQATTSAPNAAETERGRGVSAGHVACHGATFVQLCRRPGEDVIAMDVASG